jgi:hypothetical protein
MAQAVICQSFTVEARVRAHASPYETCDGQSGTEEHSCRSSSARPSQYSSTSDPYSSSSTCCSYQKDRPAKSLNVSKINFLADIGEHWIEKYFLKGYREFMKHQLIWSMITNADVVGIWKGDHGLLKNSSHDI